MDGEKLTPKTLMQHLRNKYIAEQLESAAKTKTAPKDSPKTKAAKGVVAKINKSAGAKAATKTLDDFLTFAQTYLDKYPPTMTTFLEEGIGLMLGDGQGVAIATPRAEKGMRDEGIPITRPRSLFGRGGMEGVHEEYQF